MQCWDEAEPCVASVVCTTYNHEQYIREAIDSFLMQETSFPFEIIIHDDASTDKTPHIIEEYRSRYPNIIRTVFQKENQYSKGGFKPSVFASGYSKAEYVALCEGDDYWVNNKKLQTQIEAMQEYPEVGFSFHSVYFLHDGKRDSAPSQGYGRSRLMNPGEVLCHSGSFASTPSYVFRKEILENLPEWFFNIAPVGDVFLEIFGSLKGGALYINSPMAAYRVGLNGSWSSSYLPCRGSYLEHWKNMRDSYLILRLEHVDYSEALNRKVADALSHISSHYLLNRDDKNFLKYIKDSCEQYVGASVKQRILYIGRFFPSLLRALFEINQRFSKSSFTRNLF